MPNGSAPGPLPVTRYTGAPCTTSGPGQVVQRLLTAARACCDAGFRVINCNPDPIGREKTEAELERQVAALVELGRGLQALGLKLGIHHHTPQLAHQAREFNYNFRHSPPELVGFNIDTHWMYRGGLPSIEALKAYGNRMVSWHLRQSHDGVRWEDLDTGNVDYAEIAPFARAQRLAPVHTVELALEECPRITRSGPGEHLLGRPYRRHVPLWRHLPHEERQRHDRDHRQGGVDTKCRQLLGPHFFAG